MKVTQEIRVIVARSIRQLLDVNSKDGTWNKEALDAIINAGTCPTDICGLLVNPGNTNCSDELYNARIDAHVLCSRCWLNQLTPRGEVFHEKS